MPVEPAFVGVLEVVEVTPDRELNVVARDDLTAQNRVTVAADTIRLLREMSAGVTVAIPDQVQICRHQPRSRGVFSVQNSCASFRLRCI